ncbi:hypothetical protein IU421_14780 [Nocardia cyriacigeorgica]|uniref:hypothetical protein n=1 Tax=Nocardia cyriacigeorgica TaxID=135487 RepID=UPI0018944D90|nr:hypothetical protein [Nocardia cyriacigeorgica]MBF6515535.1 hypothetical protein [Nocardia cyriacigeorgica]
MVDTPERKRKQQQANVETAVTVLNALKLASGCVDCGYRKHPAALQFDHLDPSTKRRDLGWQRDRSRLMTRSKLIAYLKHVQRYCVVRCANCHAARTAEEQHWRIRRGVLPGVEPTLF